MPLHKELNLIETLAMPLDPEGLLVFRSSQYSFVQRSVAYRLRDHLAQNPALIDMDQYIESFTFDTAQIEEHGEEVETGGGSTISLNDDVDDHEIMQRFDEDIDPAHNGGEVVKYAALAHWFDGILTVTYITVHATEEEEAQDESNEG